MINQKKNKFKHVLYYHIPTFFLLSFYYTYNTFTSFNINKIKLRFERIVLPYICWNIISFILNNIYHFILNWNCFYTIYDFLLNLLNGHMFIISLWFQNILILTTLIISIIVFLFKNHYLLIFQIILILSYRFQYSGENYLFFTRYFSLFFTTTYGRFFETFPHSMTGFYLGVFKVMNKLLMYKRRTIFISLFALIIISIYDFDNILSGFKYGGLRLNFAAICIFLIFFSLNEVLILKKIKLMNLFTSFTAGIYFIHNLVGRGFILKKLLGNRINTIYGCIIIYLNSNLFCFLLNKLIGNSKLKHLIK